MALPISTLLADEPSNWCRSNSSLATASRPGYSTCPPCLLLGLVILFQSRRQTYKMNLPSEDRTMAPRRSPAHRPFGHRLQKSALADALALLGSEGVLHFVSVLPEFGMAPVSG